MLLLLLLQRNLQRADELRWGMVLRLRLRRVHVVVGRVLLRRKQMMVVLVVRLLVLLVVVMVLLRRGQRERWLVVVL